MSIFSALNPFTFRRKHEAAWNALMAAYTFELLAPEVRRLVIQKVEEIETAVRQRPITFLEIVSHTTEAQRCHLFSLALMNLGIRPALGKDLWFEVRNPHVDLLDEDEIIASTRHQLQKKFGVDFPDLSSNGIESPLPAAQLQPNPSLSPALAKDAPRPVQQGLQAFLCPECGSRKEGAAEFLGDVLELTAPTTTSSPSLNLEELRKDPWFGVTQIVYCGTCGIALPAHIAKLWDSRSEADAAADWKMHFRGHKPPG
jgi:hypothetical protein